MRLIARTLSAVVFVAVALSASHAATGSVDDVVKAAEEIALHDAAGRVNNRAAERALYAILETERGKLTLHSCREANYGRIREEDRWDKCFKDKWPFDSVFGNLYDVFVEEELERERSLWFSNALGHERRLIKTEIRKRLPLW